MRCVGCGGCGACLHEDRALRCYELHLAGDRSADSHPIVGAALSSEQASECTAECMVVLSLPRPVVETRGERNVAQSSGTIRSWAREERRETQEMSLSMTMSCHTQETYRVAVVAV
jgi:hypothetical protein